MRGWVARNRRLHLLCRTLVENRNLAMLPRELKHYIDESTSAFYQPHVQLPKKQIALLLDRDMSLADGLSAPILAQVTTTRASEEAFVMLLTIICPKLETLTLKGELSFIMDMQVFGEILDYIEAVGEEDTRSNNSYGDAAHSHDAGIYKISNLVLDCNATSDDHPNPALIEALLRLPGLRKLSTTSLDMGEGPEMRPYVSGIEELSIESCQAGIDDIGDILSICPNLRKLSIEWMTRDMNYRRLHWRVLGDYIVESCPELRHLRIDHDLDTMVDDERLDRKFGVSDDDFLENAHLPGLGSLRRLIGLETLFLSIIALLGTHRDDHFDPDGFDSEESDEPKHTLSSLLPDSLKELNSSCPRQMYHGRRQGTSGRPGSGRVGEYDNHELPKRPLDFEEEW